MEIPNKFSSDLALEIFRISTGRKRLIFLFFFVKRLSVLEGFSPCPKKEVGEREPGVAMALPKPPSTVLSSCCCSGSGHSGAGESRRSASSMRSAHQDDDHFGFAHLVFAASIRSEQPLVSELPAVEMRLLDES